MINRRVWSGAALVLAALLVGGIVFCPPAWALRSGNGATWKTTTKVGPDAEVGGWFINLGITGARAILPDDSPTVLKVAYVFRNTSAYGKLKVGDKIVGANGKPFKTPHKFGYGVKFFGYEGPMMDFGNALEESQGKLKGKLTLDVVRGDETKKVELRIGTKYGTFSRTYPSGCAKTDLILRECYAYLLKRQKSNGSWHGRPHLNAFAALALLSTGRKEHMAAVERAMKYMASSTNDKIDYGGLDCWKYGLYGVCLGEYYLATGEKWVLEELEEINRWLLKSQFIDHYRKNQGAGGWGHRPRNRPGGNGYGPICIITAQAKAAWSLMGHCGIEIDRKRYKAAHDFLVKATNKIGYVWYKDGGAGRGGYADMGRTGAAIQAHYLTPFGGEEYLAYAKLGAKCIGTNYKTFPDTHASPILGMGWTALGAAVDPEAFRSLMDNYRWFFNLSHCPDGTFVYQPNRDNNKQDYYGAPRLSATAATALIFSIKYKRLRMTGASKGVAGFDQSLLSRLTKPLFVAIDKKQYAFAYRRLVKLEADSTLGEQDRQVVDKLKSSLLAKVDAAVKEIGGLDRIGDALRVKSKIAETKKLFGGIDPYDEAVDPIGRSLRVYPKMREVLRGREFERLLAKAGRTREDRDIAALEQFANRCPESAYGKAALEAVAHLRAGGTEEDLRDAYFTGLMKQMGIEPPSP
ncbi:MAG: DUF6288 domain-containing protein [Planctomycetota bacterium]|jgi:hypothetical protein